MKHSGSVVMRIISFSLIAFVMAYMGYHILGALKDPLNTDDAVVFTIEDTVPANGYFVRDEVLISGTDGIIRPSVDNGVRLAKGDAAFYVYRDQNALNMSARLRDLETRIFNMEYAQSQTTGALDAAQMDRLIYARLTDMLNARDSRRNTLMKSQTVEFESMVFRREYTYNGGSDLESSISMLIAEADSLRQAQAAAVSTITAPHSGAFTSEVDGYEHVLSMDDLETITFESFNSLGTRKDSGVVAGNIGKQALGFSWGHIIEIPQESAEMLKEGQKVTLRFTDTYSSYVTFTIRRIFIERGKALVSLETTENISDFINLRRLPSDVVLKSYSGLRVPKEAMRLEEGKVGVFCLMGDRAVFKEVEIITERENYFLVAFNPVSASVSGLLPADKMILGAKDIYNGKVYSGN